MWHLLISIKFYVYSVSTAHTLIMFYMFPIIPIAIGYILLAAAIGGFGLYIAYDYDRTFTQYKKTQNPMDWDLFDTKYYRS